MPDYTATLRFIDELQGETSRTYKATFADDATATTAMTNLLTDAAALSTAAVSGSLSKAFAVVGGAAEAGSRVFENLQATVLKNDGEDYAMNVPSPENAVFTANALIIDDTLWTDYLANFSTTLWKISDGEYPLSTLRGKRIFVRSGKTNLP